MSENVIIWHSMLDDVWSCNVIRKDDYVGTLTCTNPAETRKLEIEVPLAYGAIFGPDIDDVNLWQKVCMDFVDGKDTANA